ncbi:hypothetical protein [Azohydromonas lata]|uniref:hypothetical protein n=1 Tax=Azohydromonas lata TaxID=45677 RepID=UPI0012F4C511|nr:hypothetical protein [Azohydromonas lata]
MSDERLIRLENLRRVCAERKLGPKELAENYHGRYTYWRDLLKGVKPFGEKAARKIEGVMGLPDRWLDTPHVAGGSALPEEVAAGPPQPVSDGWKRWRTAANVLAEHCSKLRITMEPEMFLLLVDATMESLNEKTSEREAAAIFDRWWPLIQRGSGHIKR